MTSIRRSLAWLAILLFMLVFSTGYGFFILYDLAHWLRALVAWIFLGLGSSFGLVSIIYFFEYLTLRNQNLQYFFDVYSNTEDNVDAIADAVESMRRAGGNINQLFGKG